MDDLIERLVARTGVERPVAEKAVGIILDFLVQEGPAEKVPELLAKLPGAERLLALEGSESSSAAMGGIMGAANRLMAAGLSMAQVQTITREVVAYAREKAGEDTLG